MATLTIQTDPENNDIELFEGRSVNSISGSAATAQDLRLKSLMRLGEDQYNTQDGVDYFGTIFTPQPNFDAARQSIAQNLLEVPDVLSIQSLTIDVAGDVFSYVAQVVTIYGPVNVTQSSTA